TFCSSVNLLLRMTPPRSVRRSQIISGSGFGGQLMLNEMNDIGELMDETSDRLLSYLCENVPDKPLCIDFFIMNSRADIFAGDDRYFQPDAGIGNSRAHVYINPQTLEWEVKIN